jgi:predicted alpha/beta-hydrolase family hydrolase
MGYPFHPLGKPEKLRIEHLQQIDKPVLILQGERDSMGSRQEIMEYKLSECVQLDYLPDGDHSFKPRKVSGHSLQNNLDQVVSTTLKFIHSNLP